MQPRRKPTTPRGGLQIMNEPSTTMKEAEETVRKVRGCWVLENWTDCRADRGRRGLVTCKEWTAARLPEATGVMQQRAAEHRIELENEGKADISLEGGRTGTGS